MCCVSADMDAISGISVPEARQSSLPVSGSWLVINFGPPTISSVQRSLRQINGVLQDVPASSRTIRHFSRPLFASKQTRKACSSLKH